MGKLTVGTEANARVTIDCDDFVVVVAVVPKRLPARSAPKQIHNDTTRGTVPAYMLGTGCTHGAPDDDY